MFEGQVDLAGQPVQVAVTVVDGMVSLLVGQDPIGSWAFGEIEFVEVGEDTYSARADGDSLTFRPADPSRFREFLVGEAPPSPPAVANGEVVEPAHPAGRDEMAVVPNPPAADHDVASPVLGPLPIHESEPMMQWEAETDEYFAAGLNGPPGEGAVAEPRARFNRLPAAPTPPATSPPDREGLTLPFDHDDVDCSEVSEVASVPGGTDLEPMPASGPDAGTDPDPEPEPAPVLADEAEDPPARRSLLGRRRSRPEADKGTSSDSPAVEEGTISVTDRIEATRADRENLRQWALVGGGGLVGVAMLVVVVWVVASAMGGDADTIDETPASPVTTVVVPSTPSPPTTTALVAPVEADPVDRADAAEFVAQWNALASKYAYHMSITADHALPIETAVTSAIRITYGTDRSVTLSALPKGQRGDRDILVAMGMVVAWAEPQLSPNGRADVLGGLGIEIDDPQLDSVGGELRRNGIVYEASVLDRVLRFTARR